MTSRFSFKYCVRCLIDSNSLETLFQATQAVSVCVFVIFQIFDVNVKSAFLLAKDVIPLIEKRGFVDLLLLFFKWILKGQYCLFRHQNMLMGFIS